MLDAVLEPLARAGWDTEVVQLGGKSIHGCRACFKCWENKDNRCVFGKDVFNEVFGKMLAADAIILGSPTYFADVSSELKALIDRAGFVAMANGCTLAGKIGAAVVAVRRGGGTHSTHTAIVSQWHRQLQKLWYRQLQVWWRRWWLVSQSQ